jgi:hypothetical protein
MKKIKGIPEAEYFKAYREANKDKITEQIKAYREANKDKITEQNKAYYEANKDKIKAKERKITKELQPIKNKLKEKMLNEIYQRVKEEELGNQSPPVRTSDKSDSAKAEEHNISLKTTHTFLIPNIKLNRGICSQATKN